MLTGPDCGETTLDGIHIDSPNERIGSNEPVPIQSNRPTQDGARVVGSREGSAPGRVSEITGNLTADAWPETARHPRLLGQMAAAA
jgi:hypothetical protein